MTKFFVFASLVTVASLVTGWANAAESTPSDVVCHETATVQICETRPLEQGLEGETVKICEPVRQIVCETVDVQPVAMAGKCSIVVINGDTVISCPKTA